MLKKQNILSRTRQCPETTGGALAHLWSLWYPGGCSYRFRIKKYSLQPKVTQGLTVGFAQQSLVRAVDPRTIGQRAGIVEKL